MRHILVRLGAGQSGRYWSSTWRVFARNLLGGVVAGATAFIIAAALLGLDLHRGQDSFMYHAARVTQTIIATIQTQINQELR
jgi:hypothetical protein